MHSERFTISELACLYGVSFRALRFYEERKLLRPMRVGTERLYSVEDRARLEVILKGKRLGFSLREIEQVIASHAATSLDDAKFPQQMGIDKIGEQIRVLEIKRDGIERAIAELKAALV